MSWLGSTKVSLLEQREPYQMVEEEPHRGPCQPRMASAGRTVHLQHAGAKEKNPSSSGETNGKSWSDNALWIRLYCALYNDKTRPYLLTAHDVMNCQELDARKSCG